FVMGPKGTLARGYGAGLSGAQAALSALTETPFPYPDGGPSGPMLRKLPTRLLHELPDYSLASPAANLALLEELLISNNRPPAYVTMTRRGLDFPVVRALVPGMQLSADSDAFSRVPLRLYMSHNIVCPRHIANHPYR
ncbi:YcaO-like family protein, partial [Desulfovibrio sp. OttesenSCG-928-M14]|nr:YcaO-like family protein [Desulfovibrio sp. OttesenSCG-928-M14]